MRIVIAEKDQAGRRLLAQLLRMEGHDVLLIEDGSDAKCILKRHQPEMVLMNMFNTSRREEACLSPVLTKSPLGDALAD